MSSVSNNINNQFFAGSYKHAWKGIIPAGLSEAEADFIMEMAGLKNEGRVLDIMCGYGRHALELGRRGVSVVAIDNLEDYISEIRQQGIEHNLPVEVRVEDVVEMQLQGEFDAGICMGNSFAFFDKEDALKILHNISSHLKKDGVFIINSWMIAEIAIKYFKEKDWHYAGEYKCLLDYEFCFHPTRIESEQTIISPEGIIETVKGVDYIFTLNEIEEMLNLAGLKTIGLYSTPRKRKFHFGDTQIYIVISKA